MIYGLTVQKFGNQFELRCPECRRVAPVPAPLVRESRPSRLSIRCEVHPENFGEWLSESEMEEEKRNLAKEIGIFEVRAPSRSE